MDFATVFLAQSMEPQGALGVIDRVARTPLSNVVIVVAIATVLRLILFPILVKTPAHKRSGIFSLAKFSNEMLDAIIYAGVFVFLIIRPFVLQTFFIPSGSMVQTLQVKDYIIANKFVFRTSDPKFQDIVVFKPPQSALFPGQGETDFIKRVIGTPGDIIELRDKVLYRNGKTVTEPYRAYTRRDTSQPMREVYTNLTPDEVSLEPAPDFKLVEYQGRIIPLNMMGDLVNVGGVAKEFEIRDLSQMRTLKNLPPAKVPAGKYLMMGDNRNGSFDSRGWGLVDREKIIGRAEVIWFPVARWGSLR